MDIVKTPHKSHTVTVLGGLLDSALHRVLGLEHRLHVGVALDPLVEGF